MIVMRRQSDFQRVKRSGKSWAHPLAVLQAITNSLPYSQIGFVASKYVGNAVKRNRAKRLLREAFHRHGTNILPGWDLLLVARTSIEHCKADDVCSAVNYLLLQAALLKSQGQTTPDEKVFT